VPANLPGVQPPEPSNAIDPIIRLSQPRSVARRVVERLALAALALALGGAWIWMGEGHQELTDPSSLRGAVALPEPEAPIGAADAKSPAPAWLSPEILYAPAIAPMPAPRADVPLPTPRPAR